MIGLVLSIERKYLLPLTGRQCQSLEFAREVRRLFLGFRSPALAECS